MSLLWFLALMQIAAPPVDAPPSPQSTGALSCLPSGITKGARVVALSVYGSNSGRTMPFILAGSNNHAVHALTVTGRGDDPVILVVSAYEPILWDLLAVRGRIKAVVASGYYPQAVRGISSDVPVRFSSAVGTFNGSETCARIHYAYDDTKDIQAQANDIRRAIGTYPRIFYGNYSTDRLDIDGLGTATGAPDLSDIRASVPFITEDDPASLAKMRMLPPADEQSSGGPRLRIVEFDNAGKIVRDEGGRKPAATGSARAPSSSPVSYQPAARSGARVQALFKWLAFLGVGIFVFWQWRRRPKKQPTRSTVVATPFQGMQATSSSSQPIAGAPSRFQTQLAELSALASITDCEPLVVALHRYGREVQNLARITFDSDLADEVAAIIDRHFEHAIERYRLVRTSLDAAEGERADGMLTRAIERLALRLQELQTEQQHRDVDGVDEAARFIDARHPV